MRARMGTGHLGAGTGTAGILCRSRQITNHPLAPALHLGRSNSLVMVPALPILLRCCELKRGL